MGGRTRYYGTRTYIQRAGIAGTLCRGGSLPCPSMIIWPAYLSVSGAEHLRFGPGEGTQILGPP